MEKHIAFTKVALPYGWLGNMSPYPISYKEKEWKTTEALFQALRFDDEEIIEEIRSAKSPMGAKFIAKKHREKMAIEPLSEKDLSNMRMCISLKLEQHPELIDLLLKTGDARIYEDVTARKGGTGKFWGAALEEGQWIGRNELGKIWEEFRIINTNIKN